MRTLAYIAAGWACLSVAALVIGWRINTIRRTDRDAEAVIAAAERIIAVEQSRLNHPSNRRNDA